MFVLGNTQRLQRLARLGTTSFGPTTDSGKCDLAQTHVLQVHAVIEQSNLDIVHLQL